MSAIAAKLAIRAARSAANPTQTAPTGRIGGQSGETGSSDDSASGCVDGNRHRERGVGSNNPEAGQTCVLLGLRDDGAVGPRESGARPAEPAGTSGRSGPDSGCGGSHGCLAGGDGPTAESWVVPWVG